MRVQLENRLAEAERIAGESVSELEALRKQLEEERSARATAEAEVEALTADVAAAKAGADEAVAKLQEQQSARTAAETQVQKLTAEVAAATAGAGDAAAAVEATLRAEVTAAEEKAAGLEVAKGQLEKQLQAAQEQVSTLGKEKVEVERVHKEQLECATIFA